MCRSTWNRGGRPAGATGGRPTSTRGDDNQTACRNERAGWRRAKRKTPTRTARVASIALRDAAVASSYLSPVAEAQAVTLFGLRIRSQGKSRIYREIGPFGRMPGCASCANASSVTEQHQPHERSAPPPAAAVTNRASKTPDRARLASSSGLDFKAPPSRNAAAGGLSGRGLLDLRAADSALRGDSHVVLSRAKCCAERAAARYGVAP